MSEKKLREMLRETIGMLTNLEESAQTKLAILEPNLEPEGFAFGILKDILEP